MKKGQIQNIETIGVIIIVIVLIILGITFWSKVRSSDISDQKSQAEELSLIDIAKTLNELPELKCYQIGTETVECIDLYKALAFNKTLNSVDEINRRKMMQYYNHYFKTTKITIEQTYPEKIIIELYNNNISNASSQTKIFQPTIIRDNLKNVNNFGIITIEGYVR